MGEEEWSPFCRRAEKFEEEFRKTDFIVDQEIDRIVIDEGCSDSETSNDSSETDSDIEDM